MKFTIVNRTRYRTRHLRSFVTRSYKIAAELAGPERTRRFEGTFPRIHITFARSNRWHGNSTGHAHFNSPRCHIGLNDKQGKIDLALVIAHEIGHCFGLRHDDMRGGPLDAYEWRTGDDIAAMRLRVFGWGDSLPLDPAPVRVSTPADSRDRKRKALVERLARWQAKEKRAQNAVKRLRSKLNAFDRYHAKQSLAA